MIYFVQAGANGPVKIGRAKDVAKRVSILATGHYERSMSEEHFEEQICTCGAGHGSLEGHMDWCAWMGAGKSLKAKAAFLVERLDEWSADNLDDENARDWLGHVEPAIERLKKAIGA